MARFRRTGDASRGESALAPRRDRTRPTRTRPVVEGLEPRSLLSTTAGVADPTFAGDGQFIRPVAPGHGTGLLNFYAAAVQPDGKTLAGGTVGLGDSHSYGILRLTLDGKPDPSFGLGGEADLTLPAGWAASDEMHALLLQRDGKIVIAGTISDGQLTESLAARFNPDGTPDATFGRNGLDILAHSGFALNFPALQPDGKILLVGTVPIPSAPGNTEVAAARLEPNGLLDPTFGQGGLVTISDIPPGSATGARESVTGVALQADGRIVMVGSLSLPNNPAAPAGTAEIFRLNPDGSRDNSIGQDGLRFAHMTGTGFNGVIVKPDGGILVLGHLAIGASFPALASLNPDGSLVAVSNVPHQALGIYLNYFALQPDGKIVITGDEFSLRFVALRFNPDLTPEASFGFYGESFTQIRGAAVTCAAEVVALAPNGDIVLAGTSSSSTNLAIVRLLGDSPAPPAAPAPRPAPNPRPGVAGDYLGTGHADVAAYLPLAGAFAIRSPGEPDRVVPFGAAGVGQSIPAPGDYDRLGKTNLAVYLVGAGAFAIRPSDGEPDRVIPFGIPGPGQTLPAPGDYFGTGQTDLAAYLPSAGAFAIRNPITGADQVIPFGIPGAGQSIPVPGDYDGTGHTELAVYLPSVGAFVYRPAGGGPDRVIPFGIPGPGQTIPAPGDFDGAGHTELGVYLPSVGDFVYRSAFGGPDVVQPFGVAGAGQTIPAIGDYDGIGRDEVGAYLPAFGDFAHRPALGGPDVIEPFGMPGTGRTVPANAVPVPAIAVQALAPPRPAPISEATSGAIAAGRIHHKKPRHPARP